MSPNTTFVTLQDGAKLRVCLLGAEDKRKPLLIALHGAPGLSSLYEPLGAFAFLQEKYRVLFYDARGSGKSDAKGSWTDEQWVADLDQVRAWAGDETFVLAGGSYGGWLALEYALTYPNRLSGLILRDTWACGFRGTLRIMKNILTSPRINPDYDRQVRVWSGNVRNSDDGAKALGEILPIYTPEKKTDSSNEESPSFEGAGDFEMRWEVHNAAWSTSAPRVDVRDRLHEIKAPTLVIVGRHDPISPVEDSEEIHRGIEKSKLVVFKHSGHNPASDEPAEFEKTVGSFLDSLRLGS